MLFGIGLILGVIETIVNVEADRVEHQLNRRIMIRSHAFWSFGFFGAGGVSALAADYGLSPATQLWSTAVLVVLLTYLVMGQLSASGTRHTALAAAETTHPTPRWTAPTAGIMLLVSVCGSACYWKAQV